MAGLSDFLNSQFLNDTPDAAYRRKYKQAGQNNGLGSWLNNQYSNQYLNYKSGLPDNPNMLWTDFLDQSNLMGDYNNLSFKEQGLNPGLYQGNVQYKRNKYGI